MHFNGGNGYATSLGIFKHGESISVRGDNGRVWAGSVHGQAPCGSLIVVGHNGVFRGQHIVYVDQIVRR